MDVRESQMDADRFGFSIAKAAPSSPTEVADLDVWASERGIRMAIIRVPTNDLSIVHALEERGARLTDAIVTFTRPLGPDEEFKSDARIRTLQAGDLVPILDIAKRCYAGYQSHYHADPRLDSETCDEVYVSWARRCCEPGSAADEMLVAEDDGEVVGFFSVKSHGATGEGVLSGVDPRYRSRGLYHAFMQAAMASLRNAGVEEMHVSTQIWNSTVQRAWTRQGFLPATSTLTFHLWFE